MALLGILVSNVRVLYGTLGGERVKRQMLKVLSYKSIIKNHYFFQYGSTVLVPLTEFPGSVPVILSFFKKMTISLPS